MKKHRFTKQLLGATLVGMVASFAGSASAAGFQLFQYDIASVGNANSSAGATADSASSNWSNAAGLVRLKGPQIVISGAQVITKNRFVGTAPPFGAGESISRGSTLIPALHYASPINNKWFFGFSVTAPFGSSTNYPVDGIQRYATVESTLQVMNLSPSIAYKVNDKLSLAAGFDVQQLKATLSSVAGAAGPIINQGSSVGYGWHAGAMYQFTPATRIGLAYRSGTTHNISGGTSTLTRIGVVSNNLSGTIKLPPTTTLGIHHNVNSQWALMANVDYTQWNKVDTITLQNLAGGLGSSQLAFNFRNTFRYSVGTSYEINDKWLVRAGVGYDQSATTDQSRTLRLPDGDRVLASLGARFRITKAVSIDAGWTRYFVKDVNIQPTAPANRGASGRVETNADVVGLQLTWNL